MRYSRPQITSTLNAAMAVHQQAWTTHTVSGVYKVAGGYLDSSPFGAETCTLGAYETDE